MQLLRGPDDPDDTDDDNTTPKKTFQSAGAARGRNDTEELTTSVSHSNTTPGKTVQSAGAARGSSDAGELVTCLSHGNTTPRKTVQPPGAARGSSDTEQYATSDYHGNTRRIFYSNVLLLGPINAGKTCLVDSLLGLPFNSESTNGVDSLDCKVSTIHASTTAKKWEHNNSPLHTRIREDLAYEILTGRREGRCSAAGQNPLANDTGFSGMKILDTSGEFIFYKTHRMLFSSSTVFLIVMDASKGLDEVLPQSHCIDRNKFDYPNTPRTFLDYFLTSVGTFVSKTAETPGTVVPCAIIVLTHTDLLDHSKKRDIEKKIQRHIESQHACRYVFPQILSLSNKERRELDLVNLRVSIETLCGKRATFGLEQPCWWLNLQTEIEHYCTTNRKRYLTLSEFQDTIARTVNASVEDVREFLTFHSKCGNIVFLDDGTMESLVITDPQLLVDAFRSVWELKDERHMGFPLSCQGELRSGIARGIIPDESLIQALKGAQYCVTEDPKHLVEVLIRYGQLVPCDEPQRPKQYIVPALLPPHDTSKVSLGPCKPVDRANTLVYLFHHSSHEKTSGFLPDDIFFQLVSSLVRPSRDRTCWELIKIFANAAVFRAGSRSQFIFTLTSIASVFTLTVHLAGELKFEGQKCEISTIRAVFETHLRFILHSNYPDLNCSICVSPCDEFVDSVKKHKYDCLQILGRLGRVGITPLKTAMCFEHNQQMDTEEFHDCWFCNEINERKPSDLTGNTEKQQTLRDEKFLNKIAEEISDKTVLRKLGLQLGVSLRATDRRVYDSNSDIKQAALDVLYYDWYEKEGGYLNHGSSSLQKLQKALEEVGIKCKLL